jgi:hypothetical protein
MIIPDRLLDMGWTKINLYIYIRKKCGKKRNDCRVSIKELANVFSLSESIAIQYFQELKTMGFYLADEYQNNTTRIVVTFEEESATERKQIAKKPIEERKKDFVNLLQPYLEQCGSQMLNEFYAYWTEMNPGGSKMRFEREKVFDVGRRLATWKHNNYGHRNNKPTADELTAKAARILGVGNIAVKSSE